MNTRRKFLFDCSTAVAALALVPITSIGVSASTLSRRSVGQISHATFASQVDTTFRVQLPSGQVVKLKLLKAPSAPAVPALLGSRPAADAGNERFSLVFSGPKDCPLASAIHQFEHDELGRFEMYIGEIGLRDGIDIRYEAVFNQRVPAQLT
jgi:hypothetical protein